MLVCATCGAGASRATGDGCVRGPSTAGLRAGEGEPTSREAPRRTRWASPCLRQSPPQSSVHTPRSQWPHASPVPHNRRRDSWVSAPHPSRPPASTPQHRGCRKSPPRHIRSRARGRLPGREFQPRRGRGRVRPSHPGTSLLRHCPRKTPLRRSYGPSPLSRLGA